MIIDLCIKYESNTLIFSEEMETTFVHTDMTMKLKKSHNSHNNWCILQKIEFNEYFIIIYRCIKYESNTLIFSKAIKQKLFFVPTDRQDVCKDGLHGCMYGQQ